MLMQAFPVSKQRHHDAEVELNFGTRLVLEFDILTRILDQSSFFDDC